MQWSGGAPFDFVLCLLLIVFYRVVAVALAAGPETKYCEISLRAICSLYLIVSAATTHRPHSQEDEDDASIAAANRFLSPMEVDLARKALAAVQARVISGCERGILPPTNR